MFTSSSSSTLAAALLAVAFVAGVDAQNSSAPWSSAPSASPSSSAVASNTSSTAGSGASNPLIPNSLSPKCQQFLTGLNGDDTISSCTAPLIRALSLFAPQRSAISYTASSPEIQSALDELCAAPSCEDTIVRSMLTYFNTECSTELQASQPVVLGQYDTLYMLQPFRNAVCSKDAEDGYCLMDIAEGKVPTGSANASSALASSVSANLSAPALATGSVNSTQAIVHLASKYTIQLVDPSQMFLSMHNAARRLLRRQSPSSSRAASSSSVVNATATSSAVSSSPSSSNSSSTASTMSEVAPSFDMTGILPNAAIWSAHSLPFLFLSADMSSSILCTQCTKTVLASYISWESRLPYAIGLVNSPLLGQQGALWTGIGNVCGSGFLASTASQAGQQASLTGSAPGALQVKGAATALMVVGAAVLWWM